MGPQAGAVQAPGQCTACIWWLCPGLSGHSERQVPPQAPIQSGAVGTAMGEVWMWYPWRCPLSMPRPPPGYHSCPARRRCCHGHRWALDWCFLQHCLYAQLCSSPTQEATGAWAVCSPYLSPVKLKDTCTRPRGGRLCPCSVCGVEAGRASGGRLRRPSLVCPPLSRREPVLHPLSFPLAACLPPAASYRGGLVWAQAALLCDKLEILLHEPLTPGTS